ncbi:methyltransferase family protein [Paenibacillus cellulosilyticus]|uniref:Methyltransferase family protein n=1 Tax=Paenibacillus cellulosilyticus TaxID=375489 RepID=A0A2V2YNL9_9BACL|nr:methyltransferase domain-containing protein [Paenibacillus cellulosilyticus]PWV97411.1 methyltransferase family protein [Paenibacillus cellulosilyticus]QKS48548.1 methyltransferase domain-containing protein [Paenibacillus cellulosilyticus]
MADLQLRKRALRPELMDDHGTGGDALREAHRHLQRLNGIFGAAGPVLYAVKRLWHEAGRPRQLSVLDIGCGAGDINRSLLRWAEREGIELHLTLSDLTEEACAEARALYQDKPRVTVRQLDLFDLRPGEADIVMASQVLHHFDEKQVAEAVSAMVRGARIGCAIGDIHRHPVAWTAVWLVTRLVSRNRYIRHDGPLSVAKGFRAADWRRLRDKLQDGVKLEYAWRPLFRYACWARK